METRGMVGAAVAGVVALAVVGGAPAQPPASDIAARVAAYKRWRDLTPGGYVVDPAVARLCRLPTPEEVRRSDATHGPHAFRFVHVFANPAAAKALSRRPWRFPVGAALVKEKEPGKGFTAMVKRPAGYDPSHGDWEYLVSEPGRAPVSGRLSACAGCHAKASRQDHVFGTYLSEAKGR